MIKISELEKLEALVDSAARDSKEALCVLHAAKAKEAEALERWVSVFSSSRAGDTVWRRVGPRSVVTECTIKEITAKVSYFGRPEAFAYVTDKDDKTPDPSVHRLNLDQSTPLNRAYFTKADAAGESGPVSAEATKTIDTNRADHATGARSRNNAR